MCPFCLTSLGTVVAGVISSGGFAALAVKVSRKKEGPNQTVLHADERSNQDVNQHNR